RSTPAPLAGVKTNPLSGRWLADVSGYDRPETEVVKRVLRIKAAGAPARHPAPSACQYGPGAALRAAAPGKGATNDQRPTTNDQRPTTPVTPPSGATAPA